RRPCEGRVWEERLRKALGDSMTVILVSGSALVVMMATVALALGRAAAQADEDYARLLGEQPSQVIDAAQLLRDSYAGLAAAQAAISREPSTTVPSSRRRVGTQRLPVSSATSRLPRVWFMNPGSGANP